MSSSSTLKFVVPMFAAIAILVGVADLSGQTNRRRRTPKATPVTSPTPPAGEPVVISRADEFPDENSQAVPIPAPESTPAGGVDRSSIQTLEDLGNRIRNLETGRRADPDEKQKRLLLNLDILTRAEQRSESLRKQVFEMIEKENNVKTKLDTIEYDLRPDVIERTTAIIGSLRPEEIRASRVGEDKSAVAAHRDPANA